MRSRRITDKMSNNVRIQREIASRIFALIIVIILSTTIFSTTAIAPSGSSSGDILIPLSYPEAGGGIWVPKEVEPGHAYPVVVLLSGGDGHNAFVSPGTWKVEQRTVRPLLDQGKVHPFILVSPYAKDGSSASPIRNFNKDNFRLQELLATVDQLISQYGIAIDMNYITVAGHSNGGMFREQQPGANGVFAFISDVDTVPLYAVAILDGTHDIKSAEFIHLNLDGKPTKVFGYVGKNRQPGQLPNDWTNAFLGSDAVPCGVDYNTEFFRECKKAADRDWFNYVTYIGG
ncbi:MAG: hypothetical protein KJ574_03320, partial [Nanoarchaeota archaeon]|nr:hypothetical protein [Nanoarchaeota archaeon]